jgi:hypothetical protein
MKREVNEPLGSGKGLAVTNDGSQTIDPVSKIEIEDLF